MDKLITQIQQQNIAKMYEHCGKDSFYTELQKVFQQIIRHDAFCAIRSCDYQVKLDYFLGGIKQQKSLEKLLSSIKHRYQPLQTESLLYRPLRTGQFPADKMFSFLWRNYCLQQSIKDQLVITPPSHHDSHHIWLIVDLSSQYDSFRSEQIQRVKHWLPTIEHLIDQHQKKLDAQLSLDSLFDQAIEQFTATYLTPREAQLAKLMFAGRSSKHAAKELAISPATERVHRANIYSKLGINSQAELLSCLLHKTNGEPFRLAV
ncbi:helix-turn-helix transcriptional regulator [Vibrio sp. SCSIO 43136]|uniref:LuxR C-terminal-related transcriptional regulator n=1 Tax=Vibrio sp. SCSIO 43136 TaxID=2819101 RepID=UPI002074C0A7|nr:helix-turn-helix transcriptional regulator [Vibrio sp. SCSIO 43136]USD67805.1 helix-turn-helix transcriptional regulator [Vibrio sp. SCSIO 43136]